ncbi:MAG TPA: hypothetical protein VJM32_01780 [Candidatus Saccharimonadales bacterium]|nr:hypothetical protein [Candidatus Saccharimonadales bacterium]
MTQQSITDGEVTQPLTPPPQFQRVRYLPGENTQAGIVEAGICLSRNDDRTIGAVVVNKKDLTPLGTLGNGIARFLAWLLTQEHINQVALDSRNGLLVAVLHLPDLQTNPGLALLNRLRTRGGDELLTVGDIANLAGIQLVGKVVHPGDRTPAGCRMVDTLEEQLLAAANKLLPWRPSPTS